MSDDELRSSAFLNLVVENIPAMLAVKDAVDCRFVLLNRAGEELTGIARAESIGKSDYDFFSKEQAEFFIARDREVLQSGELLVIPEEMINTRHKGVRVLRTLKMPVPDESGKPKYLLALSVDITEQKEAEAALRASEGMFRSLLAASPDAVIVIDQGGQILLASSRVETMFGYTTNELIGKPFDVLVPDRERAAYAVHLRQFMEDSNSAAVSQDFDGLRKDKSEFPTEVSLSPNGTGGVIAAIRDITDRRSVEMQLRQAQKMEAIGNLTGGMAHDFNNLLAVIIGNLDILIAKKKDDEDLGQLGGEALEAALRGADLTKRLLAFARRQPLQPKRVDLNELITGITKLLSRTLGESVVITLNLEPNLWWSVIDPAQLDAAVTNLATNARDAMPNGGSLTIATSNRHLDSDYASQHADVTAGDYAMIEVSDTGGGMPADVVTRIFEPFFTTKEQGKGTGLGLSMVYGFMKQSGGHINVYSEAGIGTTFRLYLPRAAAESVAVMDAPATVTLRGNGETVLAVEDNPSLLRVVARQLQELGYRVKEAENATVALAILEQEPVDLLFTDVVMAGGMSGIDLGHLARERWPRIKVLITSGFPDTKYNGNGNGHDRVAKPMPWQLLNKPYRKDDLARAIRAALTN